MNDQCNKIRPDYTTKNTENGICLHIELPGVLKEDTKIKSERHLLTISAERKNNIPEEWQLINQAKVTEEYELELELHDDYNLAEVKASFRHGILKLEIAKREEVKPRQIEILD